jgi:periplasmic divalent cation tolerance protein
MYVIIFITAANKKEANRIAKELVKKRLAACINLVSKIDSVFWWQGKIDKASEALLIIKSKKSKLERIIKLVKARHSYQVPEIIALPIIGGYKPYLRWLDESIGKSR